MPLAIAFIEMNEAAVWGNTPIADQLKENEVETFRPYSLVVLKNGVTPQETFVNRQVCLTYLERDLNIKVALQCAVIAARLFRDAGSDQ